MICIYCNRKIYTEYDVNIYLKNMTDHLKTMLQYCCKRPKQTNSRQINRRDTTSIICFRFGQGGVNNCSEGEHRTLRGSLCFQDLRLLSVKYTKSVCLQIWGSPVRITTTATYTFFFHFCFCISVIS